VVSEPTVEENARIVAEADEAAVRLGETLKVALTTAMQADALENAIAVCQETAPALTDRIEVPAKSVLSLKRTSNRVRNPANAPDEFEVQALQFFEEALQETDSIPGFYTQKIQQGKDVHFRYYKPLKVGALCIACHGHLEGIAEPVQARLAELYPEDKAVGYDVGDFRGVIRVSVAEE